MIVKFLDVNIKVVCFVKCFKTAYYSTTFKVDALFGCSLVMAWHEGILSWCICQMVWDLDVSPEDGGLEDWSTAETFPPLIGCRKHDASPMGFWYGRGGVPAVLRGC